MLGTTERQATFLWQVSAPAFSNNTFLEEGKQNYLRFLEVRKDIVINKSNVIIVPTYQIDLMWHTHMLSSLKDYSNDCMKLTFSLLPHDDSVNDRSEEPFGNTPEHIICSGILL